MDAIYYNLLEFFWSQAILSDIQANAGSYGRRSNLYDFMQIQSLNGTLIEKRLAGQTIVVEFRYETESSFEVMVNARQFL